MNAPEPYPHRPVMVAEVAHWLPWRADGIYVDGTCGSGGHSAALAVLLSGPGRLICLDRDPGAVALSGERLRPFGARVQVLQGNFSDLGNILDRLGLDRVDGILLDLGMSSYQLDRSGRGFTFSREEPLDMRMDPGQAVSAFELVNQLPAAELAGLLRRFGEERRARGIAAAIERRRMRGPIRTTRELAAVVRAVFPAAYLAREKQPAARTFQALRIAVNRELDHLAGFLDQAPEFLVPGGRLCILTYHSLEDRAVKQAFQAWEKGCTCPPDLPLCVCGRKALFRRLVKKGIRATEDEVRLNPRSRSAMLRVAERSDS